MHMTVIMISTVLLAYNAVIIQRLSFNQFSLIFYSSIDKKFLYEKKEQGGVHLIPPPLDPPIYSIFSP